MPKRWNDDHLIDTAARDYIERFGSDALAHVEGEYERAAEMGDAFYCDTLSDLRDAIKRAGGAIAEANRPTPGT